MMRLYDYITPGVLYLDIAQDYINKTYSSCRNFYILNYSDKAMFDGHYTEAVLKSRGLVVDIHDDTIVGMCLPKFHNLTEGAPHHLKAYKECIDTGMSFVATEKMDGSFGNIWWDKYQQKWRCSTRGSFDSDQAIWANEFINKNHIPINGHHEFNVIVEIIYPENRIVIDYGDRKDLVLLTGFKSSGEEFHRYDTEVCGSFWNLPVVPIHHFNSIDEIVAKCETLDGNHEGYVLRFENNFRVKVKGKEYCNLHRILSGLSTKAVWENIDYNAYEIKKEWLMAVPEEFRPECEAIGKKIMDSMFEEFTLIYDAYGFSTRLLIREFGSKATRKNYVVDVLQKMFPDKLHSKILLVYDCKNALLRKTIWKDHQPEFEKISITKEI